MQFSVSDGLDFWTPIELVDGAAGVVFGAVTNGTVINPYLWSPPTLQIGARFTPADAEALAPSTASTVLTIRPGATAVTASYSAAQGLHAGALVTATAVVEPAGIGPTSAWPADTTGAIDFYLDGTKVATSAVQPRPEARQGLTSAQITLPSQGAVALTAVYSGDVTYASSTSAPVTITVEGASASPTPKPTTGGPTPKPTTPARVVTAPVPTPSSTPVREPEPASTPVAIAASPVSDVGPARGLVLTGLVAALLLVSAIGALVTIRLRRR